MRAAARENDRLEELMRRGAAGCVVGGAAGGASGGAAGAAMAAPRTASETRECPICKDKPKDTVLVPCGHMLCGGCAAKVIELRQHCPIGRERITGKVHAFM